MDSSPLLPSVHHLIQISARFMLRLKSEKEKRHFEAHGLQTCLVDCTEKYCMKNGHMSKWLAKKALADFRLRVNRSNHSIVHFWIKWKEMYVNQPWQNQDEWQLSHLRSRKHECSTSGICTRPDHHTWGLRWISCGVRSWPNRGFDWDVVEYIYTNRHTHTRARARLPLIPGRSMLACSWIPIPLRMIRREPSLNAPEHVTSWEKKTKLLFPHLSSN